MWRVAALVLLLTAVVAPGRAAAASPHRGDDVVVSVPAGALRDMCARHGVAQEALSIQAVVTGRRVHEVCVWPCVDTTAAHANATHCAASLAADSPPAVYAVFGRDGVRRAERLPHPAVTASPVTPATAGVRRATAVAPAVDLRTGILYEGWHGFAAHAMSLVQAHGGQQLSVEDVLRSQGRLTLDDVYSKYGIPSSDADGFYFQAFPAGGPYCIYRHRPGQAGVIPDCPNITATLTRHAQQLHTSGVTYVVVDSTNLGTMSAQADVIQLRPTEVLFEEWSALRAAGQATPSVAVWQVCRTGSTLWQTQLDLYNNATYGDLVLKDGKGRKVFFVPQTSVDAGIIKQVLSNGGRNDITIVYMWAEFAASKFADGLWAFFSPSIQGGQYTTALPPSNPSTVTASGQLTTTNSPLGSAITVSPSYQLQYSSMPFGAAGKLGGLTFKRQFLTAIQQPAVENLFISSWNEFIAQPQPNPFKSAYAFSMGLNATTGNSLWVDTYGTSLSRDIEGNADGDTIFSIMQSCLRVLALTRANGSPQCNVAGEECCSLNATTQAWHNVWAVTENSGTDALLTTDIHEVNVLSASGWTQNCNAFTGPAGTFCVDASLATKPAALRGPFVMATHPGPSRAALYRCRSPSGPHFFSTQSTCGGGAVMESVLGYMSTVETSETPRSLRLCREAHYYHVLGAPCPAGATDYGVFGYVH